MSRQNLCTNPKGKTDATGWSAFYGGTVQRVSDWSAEGISSPTGPDGNVITTGFKLAATLQDGEYRAYPYMNMSLDASTPYSVQMLLYVPEGLPLSGLYADTFNYDGWSILSYAYDETLGWDNGTYVYDASWVRHRVYLPANPLTDNGYLQAYATDDSPFTIYFTAVMSEPGLLALDYADGDTDGWQWNPDGSSFQSSTPRFQADLYSYLSSDTDLTALVGTRLYPNDAPPDVATPFIIYYEFATPRDQAIDGTLMMSSPRVQYSIYADTYTDALAVAGALRAAFEASDFLVVYEDERGNQDMTTGLHRRDLDVRLTHVGA